MDGQLALAILAVLAALVYLGRRALRTWFGRGLSGCAGCSCAPPAVPENPGKNLVGIGDLRPRRPR